MQVGSRVLAAWPEEVNWWYPGVVLPSGTGLAVVQFDDGDRSRLAPNQMRPLIVAPGLRVYGRWQGGQAFYPGVIDAIEGHAIHIRYDDGDEEWTSVSLVRVHTNDLPVVS